MDTHFITKESFSVPYNLILLNAYVLNYLSSSPDSQNVSVELSVRLPTIACRLDALISILAVKSFNVSTQHVTCKVQYGKSVPVMVCVWRGQPPNMEGCCQYTE
jgi:hypothetical protein